MIGELIAERYELEALVGRGGMSSVFRAYDTLLERRVALKILHEHFGADDDQVERFRREARAVAQLSHPNIVTVIDRGERDGRQYIVFEYVEGENLKQLVTREGPMPVRRALELVLPVAEALAFAHRHGLVHRDVKPQNILLNALGEPKVTDFGIARALDVQGVTHSGAVVGTSQYLAPEQASGQPVDERTDVYSLAAVLYEVLTGDVPFSGDNFVAIALKHLNEPPPSVAERRHDVSPRLDAALERAMAKDPAERFASMDDFARELEACLVELGADTSADATMVVPAIGVDAERARPDVAHHRRLRRWLVGVAGVALVSAAGFGAAVVGGVLDFGDTRSGGDSTVTQTNPPELRPVALEAVGTWDPQGTGGEHDEEIANATDADPATAWRTEGYNTPLDRLGKDGVGLVVDAGRTVRVAELRLVSETPGFTARIDAGPSTRGPFRSVSEPAGVGRTKTFALRRGTTARYYLVWITKLAPPTVDDKYRVHLNDVSARG